jgi:hypothetical protein
MALLRQSNLVTTARCSMHSTVSENAGHCSTGVCIPMQYAAAFKGECTTLIHVMVKGLSCKLEGCGFESR